MVFVLMASIQIIYVALNSFRVVLMIKGRKYIASLLSILEIFVYISGLTIVLKHLDSFLGIIVYSVSFGVGIFLGIMIEQKIALGYIALQIVSENEDQLAQKLRDQGYGVTSWLGYGGMGAKMVHLVLTKRKEFNALRSVVQEIDQNAFMITYEASIFIGGFWRNK
jgi:uncharacterized protein YebE (UPF0316 family)